MKTFNSYFIAFRQFPAAFVAILAWATPLLPVATVMVAGLSAQAEGASNARRLLRDARRGDVDAMRSLAKGLWTGVIGKDIDKRNAIGWWKKAADCGDTRSMVILAELYETGNGVAQDKNKAETLYRNAAARGNRRAISRLEKMGVSTASSGVASAGSRQRESTTAENEEDDFSPGIDESSEEHVPDSIPLQPQASSSVAVCNNALTVFSRELTQAARHAGVQDIALVRFMCNGGSATPLSDNVQSVLLEDLMAEDNSIPLTDRTNERYIEVENSLAGIAGDTAAASAVLVGEVFFAPGDAIGICTVRLFRISDCRILYAGCSFVQWSAEEAMLMGGQSSVSFSRHSFARLDDASLQKLREQAGRIGADFAFVQDTAQSSTNTLNLRAACAQILATLTANGTQAYEREFFTLAATEQARERQSIFDTNCKASAIALVKPHAATDSNLALTFQVQSTSTRRLLKNIRLSMQAVGAAGNAIVDGGGNDFDANNTLLEQELRATSPIAEVECMVPQEAMRQYHQQCFRYYNGDRKKIKRALEVAAIRGFVAGRDLKGYIRIGITPDPNEEIRESGYIGPLSFCAAELNQQYELAGDGSKPVPDSLGWSGRIYDLSAREFLHGVWDDEARYTYSITWKDGLPYKAKVRLDLTPIKDKLLKRAPQKEE